MKLKYYLRGLGTGISFTAIVLMIIYSYRTTDSKIMDRARELGMVMSGENVKQTTTENASKNKEQNTTEAESDKEDKTTESETTGAEQNPEDSTTEPDKTEPATENTTTASEQTTESTTTAAEPDTKEPSTENQTSSGNEITFTITSGMYSEAVSQKLYELGVVDDVSAFNLYLVQNGYAARIRTGTYTFTTGMSYEDVAAIISR